MRKVKFNRFIPIDYEDITTSFRKQIKGTGMFETEFKHEAVFHQWGTEWEEFESGPAMSTVALVELSDGTIEKVIPEQIKFINDGI